MTTPEIDSLPWYVVRDDLGNECEAAGIENARGAARTLLHDGASRSVVIFEGREVEAFDVLPYGRYNHSLTDASRSFR